MHGNVISRGTMLLIAFMVAVVGSFVVVQGITQAPAAATSNDCNNGAGDAGYLCLGGDSSHLEISNLVHGTVQMGGWNDQATMAVNRTGRTVWLYMDVLPNGSCGGESQSLGNGVTWWMSFHWKWELSCVYMN